MDPMPPGHTHHPRAGACGLALMILNRLGMHEVSHQLALQWMGRRPENPHGWMAAARSLTAMGRTEDAQSVIREGLKRHPAHPALLAIASDASRAINDRESSLGYAEQWIRHHPDCEAAWVRAIEDLVSLMRFREAAALSATGLERFPECGPLLDMQSARSALVAFHRIDPADLTSGRPIPQAKIAESGVGSAIMVPDDPGVLSMTLSQDAWVTDAYGAHDRNGRPFDGCFFHQAGRFIHGSPKRIIPPDPDNCLSLPCALHLAHIELRHFGHLLTDGCSAIYPLLLWFGNAELRNIPIVLHRCLQDRIPDLCKLLGLGDEQFLIPSVNTRNLKVGQLLTPAPSMLNGGIVRNGGYVNAHHPEIVKRLIAILGGSEAKPPDPGGGQQHAKLYLSRSKLGSELRLFVEERELEDALRRNGWRIFHPEQHTLAEQLAALREASCICATQGSALHLLLAIDPRPELRVILLSRNPVNTNFIRQFKTQGINHHILTCLERSTDDPRRPMRLRHLRLAGGLDPAGLAGEINRLSQSRDHDSTR